MGCAMMVKRAQCGPFLLFGSGQQVVDDDEGVFLSV